MPPGQSTGRPCQQLFFGKQPVFSHARLRVTSVDRQTVTAKSGLSPALQQKCDNWLALEADNSQREAAQSWFSSNEENVLQEALGQRLTFGGYFAKIRTGYCCSIKWMFRCLRFQARLASEV